MGSGLPQVSLAGRQGWASWSVPQSEPGGPGQDWYQLGGTGLSVFPQSPHTGGHILILGTLKNVGMTFRVRSWVCPACPSGCLGVLSVGDIPACLRGSCGFVIQNYVLTVSKANQNPSCTPSNTSQNLHRTIFLARLNLLPTLAFGFEVHTHLF